MGSELSLQPPLIKATPNNRAASARDEDCLMFYGLGPEKRQKSIQFNDLPFHHNGLGYNLDAMLRPIVTFIALTLCLIPAKAVAQTSEKSSGDSDGLPIITELKAKTLLVPVAGVQPNTLKDSFRQKRGSSRVHHALDIVAPRNTPVLSADSGRIIKLFTSKAGGLTIYTADSSRRFIYYYAHLERYRPGLYEGMTLARGDTIGYVGTSGNAPPDYPHLHFAIMRSYNIAQWSKGVPVNPAKVF
jgi:murein DD-endopeptidase MepM/ murein hydrolase activator NlpD